MRGIQRWTRTTCTVIVRGLEPKIGMVKSILHIAPPGEEREEPA